MPLPADRVRAARHLLEELGAASTEHPGGTLGAHLHRVQQRLDRWEARPALQLAGLCHAFYGTDGFATAPMPLGHRATLVEVIGVEAEAIVYLYASCDREASYPTLAEPGAAFRDRFTGSTFTPTLQQRSDFAELTAANELDVAHVDAGFRASYGASLLALFTRLRPLLSPSAWQDCVTVLTPPPTGPASRPRNAPPTTGPRTGVDGVREG
ncbi:DUF6817 domain-containing protein [Streptomyces sp. NPDC006512]|uniref:DUF6817 domain-containing protein n=1 Tax=Streptomyces sp. NPDC006512 TaxID=3154307 RepID=UPI0033ADD5BE